MTGQTKLFLLPPPPHPPAPTTPAAGDKAWYTNTTTHPQSPEIVIFASATRAMMGFSIKRLEPPLTFSHPDTHPAEGRAAPPRWAAVDPRNPRQRRLKDNRTSRWLKRESNPGRVVQGAGSARGREISVRDPGGISVVFLSRFSFCHSPPPPSPSHHLPCVNVGPLWSTLAD